MSQFTTSRGQGRRHPAKTVHVLICEKGYIMRVFVTGASGFIGGA